jgi:K(+)-stimulated pyrophosphate-energized sodium pump
MVNIFFVVFFSTLAFACLEPYFFIGYLISMALFGLYQAIFMANAGGAWDNAKKVVETELRAKGTDLHAATVVGDTVGDPFKDTSSVALNPVIKFTTLFGVLAVGLAVQLQDKGYGNVKYGIAGASLFIAMVFAYRSFYGMRIMSGEPAKKPAPPAAKPKAAEKPAAEKPAAEKPAAEKPAPKAAEKVVEKAADQAAEKSKDIEEKAAEKAKEIEEKAAEVKADDKKAED